MKHYLPIALFLVAMTSQAFGQNVGIGNTSPVSKLDVSGDLALREGTPISVTTGANSLTLPTAKNSVYRLTGATGAFSISSISAGNDGMLLTLINATGQVMTITNGSIQTNTGANLTGSTTAATVNLIYNATLAKWLVVSCEGFAASNGWNLSGNSGTTSSNFLGTTDANPLYFKTNNGQVGYLPSTSSGNISFGIGAGYSGGTYSIAMGTNALNSGSNSGTDNIAIGEYALSVNSTGHDNIAMGASSLIGNTTGNNNISLGEQAMFGTQTGAYNIAMGYDALTYNVSGSYNMSIGPASLNTMTAGSNNVALGYQAGFSTLGSSNLFLGYKAGYSEAGSNKLYISNSNTSSPLIYGDFTNKHLTINDSLTAKYLQLTSGATSGYIMQSDASGNGSWVRPSSITTATAVSNTSSANNLSTTVNGVTGAAVSIVNTNMLSISGDSISSTINGVTSNKVSLSASSWSLTGNAGTTSANFIGTTDNNPIYFKTNGAQVGYLSASSSGNILFGNSTGNPTSSNNILLGNGAGSSGSGSQNIGIGNDALNSFTTGENNIGIGIGALGANTTGNANTGMGYLALANNITGQYNVAIGLQSLTSNKSGLSNIALGFNAMYNDTSGSGNVAIAPGALNNLLTGSNNVAIGGDAGLSALGSGNVFLGSNAGAYETGSNKLYIANSSTTPIIYGDFTNKHLTINDSLTAKYAQFTDGAAAGYLLQSDASGNASWVNPSTMTHTISNTIGTNTISTTVDGGTGTAVTLPNLYTANGTLSANRTVTMNANNMILNSSSGNLIFNPSSTGKMGIGTSSPNYPLDIEASDYGSLGTTNYAFYALNTSNGTINTGTSSASGSSVSVYASGRMVAAEFDAVSDIRIKDVIGISSPSDDLMKLTRLQVTDFKYKDKIEHGDKQKKGFIAQQVESVFPEAVSTTINFLPDIYTLSQSTGFDSSSHILTINIGKAHGLKSGDKVKFITEAGDKIATVSAVVSDFTFTVSDWNSAVGSVFVYGKEVNDFHVVDYDRIYTLNVSATQQLYIQIQSLKEQNEKLQSANIMANDRSNKMQSDIDKLKVSVETLQQLMYSKAQK